MVILVALPAAGENVREYDWPLAQYRAVTGSFGEYRDGHFHTGIDLTTGGRTGLPVTAAQDGYVYRISDGWTGFGRALYLLHPDGLISVYAHLDRYNPEVSAYVKLRRTGRPYREKVELYPRPGQFAVRKGEVIGYSGESGAGLPHLHFEIRQGETMPLPPIDYLADYKDELPPEPISILFRPASPESAVDGELAPATRPFHRVTSSRYETRGIAVLEGKFAVDLIARDQTLAGSPYRLIPRRIRFRMDQGPWRQITFSSLSYEGRTHKQHSLVYNPVSTSLSQGVYAFRLYSELPRPERFQADNTGLLDADNIQSGKHMLEIELTDAAGNVTLAHAPFKATKAMPHMYRSAHAPPTGADQVQMALEPDGAQLLVRVLPGPAGHPYVSGYMSAGAGWARMKRGADGSLSAFVPFDRLEPGAVRIEVDARLNPEGSARAAETVTFVRPERDTGSVLAAVDGACALQLPENPLFAGAPVYALKEATGSAPQEATLPPDRVYGFQPRGWPLTRKAVLSFDAAYWPDTLTQLGVYEYDPRRERWSFAGALHDTEARRVSVEITELGVYGLFDDQTPPELGNAERRPHAPASMIKIAAVDRGSGVAQDLSEIRVGDAVYEDWIYDEDRKQIHISTERLGGGTHRLDARISDRLGNVGARSWTVTVR